MSYDYGKVAEYRPWKVRKNGATAGEHKHFSEAHQQAREIRADGIYYLNDRGMSVTVWTR